MKTTNNILAIIPARGGSKGIPRKNLAPLNGTPLIGHTITTALKVEGLTDCIVTTDDQEIADYAKSIGVEVPFIRPAELADDGSPMVPVVQHAITFMEEKNGLTYDIIVLLQPTSPLKTKEDIEGCIEKMLETGADNVYSMTKLTENTSHPLRIKTLEGDKVSPFFKDETEGVQRQGLPEVYRRNGAVFVFSRELIMKQGSIFGTEDCDTRAYLMPKDRSVDVDSPEDLLLVEAMIKAGLAEAQV